VTDQISGVNGQEFISIVVPCYNEEDVIGDFYNRVSVVVEKIEIQTEFIFINDGSRDRTLAILEALQQNDQRIGIIDFSRNFGKEIAMTAGIDYAAGDAVIIIDADLQDPPELIPELLSYWKKGNDVVYAKRSHREGESFLKKFTSKAFYQIMGKISNISLPEDTGDYRLLSRRAVDALKALRERERFMKGLFSWIGFSQKEVLFDRAPRFAGKTKWNYSKLWKFAIDGITSFSAVPLKIATYLGLGVASFSFIFGMWVIVKTLIWGDPVAGYPSLMTVILFLGGVQLLFTGIIGEYLSRMYSETKRRPLYILKQYKPSSLYYKEREL